MKIDVDQHGSLVLKEVFSGVLMETSEGNQVGICMRDDTIELSICPGGKYTNNWWRVNMQTGKVENMRDMASPSVTTETGSCVGIPKEEQSG